MYFTVLYIKIKGLMKMNHNYTSELFFAPPPETGLWPEIINFEEGVDLHLPSSKEGAF